MKIIYHTVYFTCNSGWEDASSFPFRTLDRHDQECMPTPGDMRGKSIKTKIDKQKRTKEWLVYSGPDNVIGLVYMDVDQVCRSYFSCNNGDLVLENKTGSGRREVIKIVLRNCSDIWVLMAQPLLRQMKTTGASVTAEKFKAAWKSPWQISYQLETGLQNHKILEEEGKRLKNLLCYYLTGTTISSICDNTCILFVHFKRISNTYSLRKLSSDRQHK